jgi:DsbC/DsbD-like thiol-disulfide interchange protein
MLSFPGMPIWRSGRSLKSSPRAGALVAWLLVLASATPAHGGSTGASENVTVTLVSEQMTVQHGRPFHVGLLMKMRGGWHTYWKNPGDAGLPLRIAWKLPEGFSAGPIQWPTPERFQGGPVMSYGYGREVLLPIEITPPSQIATDSVTIAGTFDWLECNDVCLPGSAVLDITLPVSSEPTPRAPAADMFSVARNRMPRDSTGLSFSAQAGPRAISLVIRVPFPARGGYLYLDQPLIADFGAPQGFEQVQDGCRLTMSPAPNAPRPPERLTGVLVFEDHAGGRPFYAVQVDVPVSPGDPAPAAVQPIPPVQLEREGELPAAAHAAILALLGLGFVLVMRRSARIHGG